MIAQAAGQQIVRISPMTVFEIVALHTAGRLQLSQPVEDWIVESPAAARSPPGGAVACGRG